MGLKPEVECYNKVMKTISNIVEAEELWPLIEVLQELKKEGFISLALLYGSFAEGKEHARSDIDLAIYLNPLHQEREIEVIDRILLSTERDIHILRLDDDDESPFVVQEALKGINLVEPDKDIYYKVADRALHEAESIRFKRGIDE